MASISSLCNPTSSDVRSQPLMPQTRRKRQIIALACDTCRAKKTKCDGFRPCRLCAIRKDKGAECAYRDRGNLAVAAHVPFKDGNSLGGPLLTRLTYKPPLQRSAVNILASPELHEVIRSPSDRRMGKSRGIDSIVGVVSEDPASHELFGGSSSTGLFMRQIKSAIDIKIGLSQYTPFEVNASPFQLSPPPPTLWIGSQESFGYSLPSRKAADNLMGAYWTLVHPLYPFLDRQMFEEAYESLWSGSSRDANERMLMCAVNVIFALGCQLSESTPPEQREASARVYFKRAQDLLRLDLWDVGAYSVPSLNGTSTNTPHQCWMAIGHAIRVAQSLGFHLPESSFGLRSPRDRELVRRIWHGCILMDRVLSMTFGQPAIISKPLSNEVPMPAMIDDEFLSHYVNGNDKQPEQKPAMMAFFVKSLHLYDTINDILMTLYVGQNTSSHKYNHGSIFQQPESSDIARVFQLDQALMTWGQTLPLHLRLSSLEWARESMFFRQAVVCRARWVSQRIGIYEPPINLVDAGSAMDESLAERMVFQCSKLCLRTAHDMIDLIYTNIDLRELRGPLPAWWDTVLYIYAAATILLAPRLRPVITEGILECSIADSWAHAIEILKAFQHLGQSAQRCVAALEILSKKVSPHTNSPNANQDLCNEFQRPATDSSSATMLCDVSVDVIQVGFDLSGITFDLNDMSWLTSLPGNL